MAVKHVGNAIFVDTDPVEGAPNVFPYVKFHSLERAEYGLNYMEEETKADFSMALDSIEVGETTLDPSAVAPLTDFDNAMEALRDKATHVFEEFPMVEVKSEDQWKQVQQIQEEREPDTKPSVWEGPGVYDFREFFKAYDSVEKYEEESMIWWADEILDGMFQDDEWKNKLKELVDRNKPEGAEPVKAESSQFTHRRANRMDANEMLRMVANTGYTDIPGKLHAAYLLGQATGKFWKEAVAEIKKKFGKEMHREVARLQRWGTAQPSEANIKDVIRKILIKNGINPYSELVFALYKNPFGKTGRSGYQTRGVDADGMTPSRSEPR